jgi:hypothetical protein
MYRQKANAKPISKTNANISRDLVLSDLVLSDWVCRDWVYGAGTSYSIWEKMKDGDAKNRFFVGNEIGTSTPMASGKGLFLGLWRYLYLMTWTDGLSVTFDRYTLADYNETMVRADLLANVGLTFPSAFCAVYQN